MARNLTLTLDDDLLRAARKVAIDRNTSVNRLVRDFLAGLVRETDRRNTALTQTDQLFQTVRIEVGARTWSREDLQHGQRILGVEVVNPFLVETVR